MEWYIRAFKKATQFSGRAHRREYWMFFLWNAVFGLAASIVDRAAGLEFDTGIAIGGEPVTVGVVWIVYSLVVLVPSLAIVSRRLHDVNRSGWWQLIGLIPIVGLVVVIVWLATQGMNGPNQFGPDPRLSAHAG